ncbi:MAG TPA: chemotaxis protein CheW [Gammaproteobacteria bacterium]|jgi:chemotaxis signal transduction protein|nr:chemotaxis protein CheW [Gammaproteobacteria bacterium]
MAEKLDEVYSLLIPVAEGKLLLPRLAVAEVTGLSRTEAAGAGAPDWLLGHVRWQDRKIAVVSFEALCGRPAPAITHRARLMVVHAIGGRLSEQAFGLVIQGYPYLVRVNANILKASENGEAAWTGPVLARPQMANEKPMIPDVEAIEERLAESGVRNSGPGVRGEL